VVLKNALDDQQFFKAGVGVAFGLKNFGHATGRDLVDQVVLSKYLGGKPCRHAKDSNLPDYTDSLGLFPKIVANVLATPFFFQIAAVLPANVFLPLGQFGGFEGLHAFV